MDYLLHKSVKRTIIWRESQAQGGPPDKKDGDAPEKFEKSLRGTKILLCGRGLNVFSSVRGTNSHYLRSWVLAQYPIRVLFPVDRDTHKFFCRLKSNVFNAASLFQTNHVVHRNAPHEGIFLVCRASWLFRITWCSFTTRVISASVIYTLLFITTSNFGAEAECSYIFCDLRLKTFLRYS